MENSRELFYLGVPLPVSVKNDMAVHCHNVSTVKEESLPPADALLEQYVGPYQLIGLVHPKHPCVVLINELRFGDRNLLPSAILLLSPFGDNMLGGRMHSAHQADDRAVLPL